MKKPTNNFTFLLVLALNIAALAGLSAQRQTTNGTFIVEDVAPTSYILNGETYNFGADPGGADDYVLDTFTVGTGGSLENWAMDRNLTSTVRMRLPSSQAPISGDPAFDAGWPRDGLRVWYESDEGSTPSAPYTVSPGQINSYQDALAGGVINRGGDNILSNRNFNGNPTGPDFERVDFIFEVGLEGSTQQLENLGFVLNDRGANHTAAAVAITGLDSSGNPTSFGPEIVRVPTTGTGTADYGILRGSQSMLVMNPVDSDGNPVPGASDLQPGLIDDNSQNIGGVLITFDEMGIQDSERFYGWALVADDTADAVLNHASVLGAVNTAQRASAISALLLNLDDTSIYPQGTQELSGSVGGLNGLDPTAITGNIVYNSDIPDPRNDFVQPEPGLALAPLAFLLCLFNRRLTRRLFAASR